MEESKIKEQPKYFVSQRFQELDGKLIGFRRATEADVAEMNAPVTIDWLVQEAHEIENWPNLEFRTGDGRRFGLYTDGASIIDRLILRGIFINQTDTSGIAKLKQGVAGLIMEIGVGNPEPPLIFKDMPQLALAWEHHHKMFEVGSSDDSENFLNTYLG